MSSFDPRHPWSRLIAAARRARHESDATPPYGFATRVAALAFAQERRAVSLLERFAFRAVGLACLFALASVAVNYPALSRAQMAPLPYPSDGVALPVDDAIAAVLDFGD